ncbi:MAG: acyl-CoA dehydrogenase family protein, partial [Chloroflexi bacterium]|nr:acyl-CoA dehydrogenase family protein [Chloroflexota bacterium]
MSPVQFGLTPEQLDFQREVRELADREFAPRAAHWDQAEQYPWDNVKILLDHGLMGLTIPPEYGGRGRTLFDAILAVEQVARACGNTARIVVEANMGAVGAIVRYGTEEQKRYYLPIVAREGDKPAIAISEPEAGSAATEMRTTARLEGDSYVLNGQKRWITGAGASRIHVVFARMNDRPGAKGIGGILVEKGTPGFRIGKRWPMMGIRGMPEAEIHLENCVVPRANALVTEDGFKKLMTAYNAQRVGASTVALGIAQGAFEYA